MNYTTLGKTNLRVSVAGLGTGGFSRLGLKSGKTEDEAVEKLARYVQRYLPVAKRVRLGSELTTQTDVDIIGRQNSDSTNNHTLYVYTPGSGVKTYRGAASSSGPEATQRLWAQASAAATTAAWRCMSTMSIKITMAIAMTNTVTGS